MVPISLLHRDGCWMSVSDTNLLFKRKVEVKPHKLAIVPLPNNEDRCDAIIKTQEEYFDHLRHLHDTDNAIINLESGRYLSCGSRSLNKTRFPVKYNDFIGTCEKFTLQYNQQTGGISFKAHNDFFLTKRKNGISAFKGKKTKEEAEWLVIPNLVSFISGGDEILFVGVMKQDKSVEF